MNYDHVELAVKAAVWAFMLGVGFFIWASIFNWWDDVTSGPSAASMALVERDVAVSILRQNGYACPHPARIRQGSGLGAGECFEVYCNPGNQRHVAFMPYRPSELPSRAWGPGESAPCGE